MNLNQNVIETNGSSALSRGQVWSNRDGKIKRIYARNRQRPPLDFLEQKSVATISRAKGFHRNRPAVLLAKMKEKKSREQRLSNPRVRSGNKNNSAQTGFSK